MALDASRLSRLIQNALEAVDRDNKNNPDRNPNAAKAQYTNGLANAIVQEIKQADFFIPAGTTISTPAGPATFPTPVKLTVS